MDEGHISFDELGNATLTYFPLAGGQAMTTTIFELPVHPWAARFPMRSEEDLRGMAESIKDNGLRMPIVLGQAVLEAGGKPMLCIVDGRNRLAACKLAGIEPHHTMLNGEDLDAFIADANLERRDLSKGQKAMLLAVRYPNGTKGRNRDPANREESSSFFRRVQQARMVLRFCPEMVEAVIASDTGLDEAYAEAQRRRQIQQAAETRIVKLTTEDPDLADLVREERIRLSEAEAAARERREDEARWRNSVTRVLDAVERDMQCLRGEQLKKTARTIAQHPEVVPFADLRIAVEEWVTLLHDLLENVHEQVQQQQTAGRTDAGSVNAPADVDRRTAA